MKKLLTVLAVIVLVANFVSAQPPDTLWTRTYGGTGQDNGYSVQQTSDGGYILTGGYGYSGYEAGVYLVKTDTNGDTLWTKMFSEGCGFSVKQTTDGGYIIAGLGFCLIKTNENGDTLWTKTYGGNIGGSAYDVEITSDNGYIIVGDTWTTQFSEQLLLVKTNGLGDTLWTKTYGGSLGECGYSVKQTLDGSYIIAGRTQSYGYGNTDIWLIKTNSTGDTLWTKTLGGAMGDFGRSVQLTNDNGLIIAGYTDSFGPPAGYNYYLIKTNANGDTLWTHTYGNPYVNDYGMSVHQTDDDGYIISGSAGYTYDLYLVRTDSLGNIQWTKTLGGNGNDYGSEVQVTSDGGYIVIGSYYNNGYDVWLIRIESDIPPSPIVIELTPHSPPIQIPSGGGSFQFDLQIINQSQIAYVIDIWTDVSYQGSSPFPIITRTNITIPSGATITRPDLTQYVPASAQAGNYSYAAHVRDHNTWQVLAEDSFPFEKLAGDNTPNHNFGWSLLGWDEPTAQTTPTEFSLRPNYPNPFNPTTIISFTLPQASYVNLTVYNLAGGRVVELANKFLSAGRYTYAFNGTNLSSGIYIAKLQAGEYQASQKMILLK